MEHAVLSAEAWRQNQTALTQVGRRLSMAAAALLLLLGALGVTLAVTADEASAHPAREVCTPVGTETVQWGSQPYQSYERTVYVCHYIHDDHPGPSWLDWFWDIGTIIF